MKPKRLAWSLTAALIVALPAVSAAATSDTTPPSVPGGLTVSAVTSSGFRLAWNASSATVNGYHVYQDGKRVATTGNLWHYFSSLSCGTTYTLAVDAYSSTGTTSAQATLKGATSSCGGTVAAPALTSAPTISGSAVVGQKLTATTGSWSGSPTSYSFQWQRCDSSGGSCANISAANSSTYTLASADQGATVRVTVIATNAGGSSPAASTPTALIAASTTTTTTTTTTPTTTTTTTTTTTSTTPASSYDATVLADKPVGFWDVAHPGQSEPDLSGSGHSGTYKGGTPTLATMPNGDQTADFNGNGEYMTIPSSPAYSITTTRQLTWEAWIRGDTLQFPRAAGDAYVDFLGKCANYSPTCEWEGRDYSSSTPQGRCNRVSGYVFNPSAGLGSAADWQPNCNMIKQGQWLHVVAEYQTLTTPSACNSAYPGSIDIWVDGVKWNPSYHYPTGCMSQYSVKPVANSSPVNVGAMAMEYWFSGAVGKVAIYNHLLSQSQISSHFTAMTGLQPSGSCANSCTLPW